MQLCTTEASWKLHSELCSRGGGLMPAEAAALAAALAAAARVGERRPLGVQLLPIAALLLMAAIGRAAATAGRGAERQRGSRAWAAQELAQRPAAGTMVRIDRAHGGM